MGHWQLTDCAGEDAARIPAARRLLHGDDFWGPTEWEIFMDSMKKVFPDRQVVELENKEAIFHTVYDLDDRYQVASHGSVMRGVSFKCDGCPDHWRGIYDDHGRLMVAMTLSIGPGRFLGVGRRSALPGAVFRPGNPHRRQLRRLRDDALV